MILAPFQPSDIYRTNWPDFHCIEEGNVNNNKEYDVKKREYEDNLTKKFRSTMLKDAAVKMQYKQSIEAQLDQ